MLILNRKTDHYIAFDLGAESGRAILGKIQKGKIRISEIYRFKNAPLRLSSHLHWNIYKIFEELKKSLYLAKKRCSGRIKSIGIDSWGTDFGLVGKEGSIIGLPISYRDHRTDGIPEKIDKIIAWKYLYQKTGIQRMRLNTLYQLYAWHLEKPEEINNTKTLLFIPDILNYFFSGKMTSEYTIASTSQFLNVFTRDWERKIFERLGMPSNFFPTIVPPGTRLGKLMRGIIEETGSDSECEVTAVGLHDTASAVAAVPTEEKENWAYISSGTWSLSGIETGKPIINNKSLMYNFTNEGGINNTIRFLKNITGLWLFQGIKRSYEKKFKAISYAELIKKAVQAKPFQCFLYPEDKSFHNPSDMIEAIDEFCDNTGQKEPQEIGDYARCVLESLAFRYKQVLKFLHQITNRKIEIIHIVGGGAKNNLLNQFTANALNMSVIAGPFEATALGNIIMQAISFKQIKNITEARKMIKDSFDFPRYEPENVDVWEKHYERYLELIERI